MYLPGNGRWARTFLGPPCSSVSIRSSRGPTRSTYTSGGGRNVFLLYFLVYIMDYYREEDRPRDLVVAGGRAGPRPRLPDSPPIRVYGVLCCPTAHGGRMGVKEVCVCVVVFVVFVVKNVRTMGPVLGQCAICS